MSDDRQFRIRITTDADLGGVKSATAALNETATATEKGAKSAKLFSGAGGELRKVINQMTQEFPALGVVMRAALSPIGALLTGAIVVFRSVKKHIDELNAAFDTMERSASRSIGNMRESMAQARDEIEKTKRALESWRRGLDENPSETSDQLALKIMLARGRGGGAKEELGLTEEALGAASGKLATLRKQEEAAAAALLDPARVARKKDIDKQIRDMEQLIESTKAGMTSPAETERQQQIQALRRKLEYQANPMVNVPWAPAFGGGANRASILQAISALEAQDPQRILKSQTEALLRRQEQRRMMGAEEDEYGRLRGTIGQTNAEVKGLRRSRDKLTIEVQLEREGQVAAAGETFRAGVVALRAQQAGQNLTASQTQQLAALQQLLQSVGWRSDQVLALLSQSIAKHEGTDNVLKALQARMAQLETRLGNLRNP